MGGFRILEWRGGHRSSAERASIEALEAASCEAPQVPRVEAPQAPRGVGFGGCPPLHWRWGLGRGAAPPPFLIFLAENNVF